MTFAVRVLRLVSAHLGSRPGTSPGGVWRRRLRDRIGALSSGGWGGREGTGAQGEAQLFSQNPPASCALHRPTQPDTAFVGPGYLHSFHAIEDTAKKKKYTVHGTLLDKENFL